MEIDKKEDPEERPLSPWSWDHTRLLMIWVFASMGFALGFAWVLMRIAKHMYNLEGDWP